MKVIECKTSMRCELGGCKNHANRAIKFDRVGIKNRIYACDKCLNELYTAIGETVVPKSIETAKKNKKGDM